MGKLGELFRRISWRLSPSDMETFTSLIEDFRSRQIKESQLLTSLVPLFEKHESFHLWFRQFDQPDEANTPKARDSESPKKDVSEEKNVTQAFGKMDLEGKKKRGMMYSGVVSERSLKKSRITPSYRRIPKDEQSPVSHPALNNTCVIITIDESGNRELTDSETALAYCEDDMYEADMLVETLKSAVKSTEKVMNGQMRMEDIGVKFYRCMGQMYNQYTVAIVRQHHREALPVVLRRLRQKLNELTVARENMKPGWKQVFQKNSAKDTDSTTAQGRRKTRFLN